jgi:hypothetical protein
MASSEFREASQFNRLRKEDSRMRSRGKHRQARAGQIALMAGMIALASASTTLAQNVLLNPGFESGYTTNWTLEEGSLTGDNQGTGESPRSGTKSWHGAWNWTGSAQITTYYQDVAVAPGSICSAGMWCKANAFDGVYGNDTHRFRLTLQFRDASSALATHQVTSPDPDDTYQHLQLLNRVAPAGTTVARVKFSYITDQPAHAWKVWNIDDMSLEVQGTGQPVITGISPDANTNDASQTDATVYGINLDGVNVVNLVGPTTIVGSNITPVAPDYEELTVTFPTNGEPCGVYDLVVEKPGEDPKTLEDAFWLLNPNAAGDLLLNGGFENDPGNSQAWYGIYERDKLVWFPDPLFVDGSHRYSVDLAPTNQHLDRGFWQVVAVPPGAVFFEGYVSVGAGLDADNSATIRMYDGRGTGGTLLDEFTVDQSTERVLYDTKPSDGWARVALSGSSTSGDVTIQVECSLDSGPNQDGNSFAAVHLDAFSLFTCEDCTTQHLLTGGQTWQATDNEDPQLVITGSNMQEVTSVKLVQLAGNGSFIYSENIYNQTASSLTVDFDWPIAGAPLGLYSVITEQAATGSNCPSQVLDDALTIDCFDPTSFASAPVIPASLTKPQGTDVQLTISGVNIDRLDEVKLVWTPEPRDPPGDRAPFWVPTVERVGTVIDDSDPDNVVMSFDLFNAQAGMYKLVGTRNDVCGSPSEALDAFELEMPAGDNLLVNGGFEDGIIDPWVITPDDDVTSKEEPQPGPELIAGTPPLISGTNCDNQAPCDQPGNPDCQNIDGWGGFQGAEGDYWVGTRSINLDFQNWITPNGGSLEQSVGLPLGPGQYSLTASVQVRIWDTLGPGAGVTLFFVVDGVDQPGVTAELNDPFTQDGLDPYTTISADFIGEATADITLKMQIWTNADSGFDVCPDPKLSIVAIDDAKLIGDIGCHVPFADADEDGDIDQVDFAIFQLCIGADPLPDECRCFDTTSSGSINATDVVNFINCATGPDVLHATHPNPNCIQQP